VLRIYGQLSRFGCWHTFLHVLRST
jgi:hypothetical protein